MDALADSVSSEKESCTPRNLFSIILPNLIMANARIGKGMNAYMVSWGDM